MQYLMTGAEMRAAEAEAATRGLQSEGLMQLAARGAARAILSEPSARHDRYLVLAGPGNNGGDALVTAGLLHRGGAEVRIVTWRRAAVEGREAVADPVMGADMGAAGLPRFDMGEQDAEARLRQALLACDAVVDGLLGTGSRRSPGPDLLAILHAVHTAPSRPRVIALDLPTGVDADCGAADDAALNADLTLTFGYIKRGLLLYPAREHCGEIQVVDIGLPEPPAVPVAACRPDPADVAGWMPQRAQTVQKYSAGAVLALAGSPHYVGAPILTCNAALRTGAGYVTLATTEDAMNHIAGRLLEATMLPLPNHGDEGPGDDALPRLQEISGRYRALLIGPGLGRTPRVTRLVLDVLGGALDGPRAAVVDADALYALSITPDWHRGIKIPIVLTPHSGEMARLIGGQTADVEADRFAVAATWAARWGQVLVLKGAPTIVASPDGALSVNPTGNPLLATAGTGDVLSGIIAALLAGGAQPYDAARAAVYLHGLAADLARDGFGDRGMVAGDLIPLLPDAIAQILQREA